jgi:3-deoxy-D-manno-octulosonate 8-phosphate phosphatase (KDO 8-P phosphatase)
MSNHNKQAAAKFCKAPGKKLFIMDLDGTYTTGQVYWLSTGEEMISCHSRDTAGIFMARNAGIHIIAMSGRTSQAMISRLKNIKVEYYLNCTQKHLAIESIMADNHIHPHQIAFISDDTIDIEAMKMAGLAFCPASAHPNVIKYLKSTNHGIVLKNAAGNGAIREALSYIVDDPLV